VNLLKKIYSLTLETTFFGQNSIVFPTSILQKQDALFVCGSYHKVSEGKM
jgi:hypothetical protein